MKTRPHILMIDDDAQILKLATQALSSDYHVRTASGCLEAVDLLLTERFDLLMIDVTLPVVDGVELIRMIRANAPFRQIPIIALPSTLSPKTFSQLGDGQVQAILPKPFSVDELSRMVANTISRASGNRIISIPFGGQLAQSA